MKHFLLILVLFNSVFAAADNLSDANKLFDWAESNYQYYFSPPGARTFEISGYLARYYSDTGNYLGTRYNAVYVYGDEFNGLMYVGKLPEFISIIDNSVYISTPTSLSAKPNDSQITVTWDPSIKADSYNIYIGNSTQMTKDWKDARHANVSSPYTFKNLRNNETYYIFVTAVSSGVESDESIMLLSSPYKGKWLPVQRLAPKPNYLSPKIHIGGKIYLLGVGTRYSDNSVYMHEFNTASGLWLTKLYKVEESYNFGTVSTVGGKIYTLGSRCSSCNTLDSNYVYEYDPLQETRTFKLAMTRRNFESSSSINGKIYIFGGKLAEEVLDLVEVYDPEANTVQRVSPMPTARLEVCTAVANGKIYVLGGHTGDFLPSTAVEVYDPIADSWTQKVDRTTERWIGNCITIDNHIYVFGHDSIHNETTTVEVYNPVTDTWKNKSSAPIPVRLCSSDPSKKIHCIKGENHLVYDPETDTWDDGLGATTTEYEIYSRITSIDKKIYGLMLGPALVEYDTTTNLWTEKLLGLNENYSIIENINGKLYFIEPGYNYNTYEVLEYDTATNTITEKGIAPTVRKFDSPSFPHMESAVIDGKLYTLGWNDDADLNNSQGTRGVSAMRYDPVTDKWENIAVMPGKRSGGYAIGTVNGKLYVVGGKQYATRSYLTRVQEYDPETNTWSTKSSTSIARYRATCSAANGKLYIIGGRDSSLVEEYDPKTDTWKTMSSMSIPRQRASSTTINGEIYVHGGWGLSTAPSAQYHTIEIFLPNEQ